MLTALLIAAAGLALGWPQIAPIMQAIDLSKLDRRHLLAGLLIAAAVVVYMAGGEQSAPTPAPGPAPDAPVVLTGKFIGPTAAADAQMLGALCDEIATCIEVDGMRPQPRLTTGVAFDDLRIAAREGRMRGESLGARQPQVRDAIHQYLDKTVGVAGGPVTPEQRSQWIAAYRNLSRACDDVTK